LINGEPTDNRLGVATRGVLRVKLRASGRAAHSSFPELGDSAIDKLLDALMVLRGVALPEDPVLGRTHYTVGLIDGGVAPNVVSPHASAELLFRIVGDGAAGRAAARTLCNSRLRTASGPEGSSAKQTLRCAAGAPGRGGARPSHFQLSNGLSSSRAQMAASALRRCDRPAGRHANAAQRAR